MVLPHLFVMLSVLQAAAPTLLVRPKASTFEANGLSVNARIQNTLIEKIEFEDTQSAQNFAKIVDRFGYESEPLVEIRANDVYLNYPSNPAQGDPLSSNQWSLFADVATMQQYGAVDIDAARAWQVTKGSAKVFVFVLDSGIDDRDPDLIGRVIDGYNVLNTSQPPVDENGHGTHVTSILGARGENDYGIKGVVPGDIQIISVKFLNAENKGNSQGAINGIQWMRQRMQAIRDQVPDAEFVMNNSWGSGASSAFLEQEMAQMAADFDVSVITSAGNDSQNIDALGFYPCVFQIIGNTCVGASDKNDLKAGFSGWGPNHVHLLAPGTQIYAIIPGLMGGNSYTSGYDVKQGTSQAVPHVAGVAALVRAARPGLNATQVRQVILESVDRLPQMIPQVLSGGRLNAYRAVLMATGQDPSKADRSFFGSSKSMGACSLTRQDVEGESLIGALIFVLGFLLIRRSVISPTQRNSSINN